MIETAHYMLSGIEQQFGAEGFDATRARHDEWRHDYFAGRRCARPRGMDTARKRSTPESRSKASDTNQAST
jgi:hypothetical protein